MDILTSANLLAWALQAGIVILVAAPLPRLLGLWSPGVRMAYWRVVLIACLFLPLLQPWATTPGPGPAPLAAALSVDVVGTTAAAGTLAPPVPSIAPVAGPSWTTPATVRDVIVAGIVVRLGWLGLGLITVSRLRRAASRLWPRPPSIDRAATLAETDAEFLVSATTSRPVTCGVLWPVVMVPRNFESFPEHEQTAIACHELLHVSRSDWVRNVVDELVRAALWFHPPAWWLINQIQLAREQVVDREAVRRLGARQPYLEALLRLARPAPHLILTPASLFLKRAHLRQRVTLLVKEASMSRARLVASLAIMAIVIFVGGRLVTSAFPLQQTGARTPGVQTGALLDATTPVTFKFGAGTPAERVLGFICEAAGLTFTTEGDVRASLSTPIGGIELSGVTVEEALGIVLRRVGLTFRVTAPRAIVVRRAAGAVAGGVPGGVAGGVPGGVTGGVRPGVATGIGTGIGVGSGSGPGVAGGVSGGVGGGVSGGVGGGVTGGVSGGVVGPLTGILGSPSPAPQVATGGIGGSNARGPGNFGVIRRVDPAAPGMTGRTLVGLLIDAAGNVGVATQAGSRGVPYDAQLAQAAAEAAKQWQFEPGQPEVRTSLLGFNFTPQNTGGLVDPATVRIGGNIPLPIKVRDVKPVYPKEASDAGVQGVQILEISIDPSGVVLDARALRGQLSLIPPAIDAVLQWQFEPWSGPERRLMTVTVNFTLDSTPPPGTAAPARDVTSWKAPETGGAPVQYGSASNWPTQAIRVGGNIKPPNKTVDVRAVYPDVAQKARVQGVVICEVLIGPDGRVADARVVRSIQLLDQAAVDAVRQWEFTPTLLNGNPIPVIMTVTVNFTLQ
jgi:TonB family protein